MQLKAVSSSNIKAVGYDPEQQKLHVQFRSGTTHCYDGVSAKEHEALLNADSIGTHFHANIRNNAAYKSSKVEDE